MVEGDRELLAQALGNLLDNAIDFTPSAGEILIGAEERDGGVLLTVCDTGCGIPDYALGRILNVSIPCLVKMGKKAVAWGWRLFVKSRACIRGISSWLIALKAARALC
ncbi:two-component response regulator CreC [Klebsiella michiganensis]|uniref:histidine kinase n=1 Tax=Klebsiella michiganensis TaxID=1134687 RepID=A0A7H4M0E0_9ENTR|nr:two-component response regulator CreC [Klebsiella michiganensis]